MDNADLIDSDRIGGDNRGSSSAPGYWTTVTDECGRAVVALAVSMQPGDNYRAAATLLDGVVNGSNPQVDQATADALSVTPSGSGLAVNGSFFGYKVPVRWRHMLPVWRKLHIETDSKASTTFTPTSPAGSIESVPF